MGSPRFLVGLQDGANVHYVNILLGNAPNYNDTDPATFTAAYSGFNVIGNEDTGRYDTSHFAGGSPYTTYSSALAQLGDLSVVELDLVIDSGTPDRPMQLVVNSFDFAAAATSETPLPAALPLFASGLGALGFVGWRKRRKRIA